MSWAAVAGAAVGVVGSQMGKKDKNGGAGTTTTSKEPWDAATPWLTNELQRGSDLSHDYAANPFSEQQKQAYANSYALSDQMRALVPGLLQQMQGQPGGFDRNNPTAKPNSTWDWGAIGSLGGAGGAGGSGGSMAAAAQRQGDNDAAAKAAAAEAERKRKEAEAAAALKKPGSWWDTSDRNNMAYWFNQGSGQGSDSGPGSSGSW